MDLGLNHFRSIIIAVHLCIVISNVEGRENVLLRRPLQTHGDWFVIDLVLMSVAVVTDSMERVCQATFRSHFNC